MSILTLTLSLLNPKSSITVTKAVFSVFNHFKTADVRLELDIPGSAFTSVVAKCSNGCTTERINWEETYVSSVLRSFTPQLDVSVRILPELMSHPQLDNFLKCVLSLIKKNVRLSKTNDVIKTTQNTLAGKVISYLLKKCLFEDCRNFLKACTIVFTFSNL
jgi:hypothetical protein